MKTIIEKLQQNSGVSDYRICVAKKESYELFFVKGKLETVRRTDTCDQIVTVYVDHGDCRGDAQFFVYPSTTQAQLAELIQEAVDKAWLIQNKAYRLPAGETGVFEVPSDFAQWELGDLAAAISQTVFAADTVEGAALNAVEVFVNKHTQTVKNSRGLEKTQVCYDAMVEAIPTYNGETQSVELYEEYSFSAMDPAEITAEIASKLEEVRARYAAKTPDRMPECPVVLNKLELRTLFSRIAGNLNYATVYGGTNLFSNGDRIQKAPAGDKITMTMTGMVPGSVRSACFDADGLSLAPTTIVKDGAAVDYYGSNRFGQYLGLTPTGDLPCLMVEPGSAADGQPVSGPYLEVLSMSGLQVDFHNDYLGGEVRLAYYHDGGKVVPLTGISISGRLSQVLETIRFSAETAVSGGYQGPKKAILEQMKIF